MGLQLRKADTQVRPYEKGGHAGPPLRNKWIRT